MQICKIGRFDSTPKTNNLNTKKYTAKTDYNGVGDTFTFGINAQKEKQTLTKVLEILPETQEMIDKVIKLIEEDGSENKLAKVIKNAFKDESEKTIKENLIVMAEKLPNGNFRLTMETAVAKNVPEAEKLIVTTKNGNYRMAIHWPNGKIEQLEFYNEDNEFHNAMLRNNLLDYFLWKKK